ncbi:MAG: hypothetical protein AB7I19_09420 [Planctomycetota bacterium]
MKNLLLPELPAVLGGTDSRDLGDARSTTQRIPALWLGLLAILTAAVWLPLGAYWRSDDFLAVHYAGDLGRALSDFGHNQYDLSGVVWFYRPLVTLSFWIEQAVCGGPSPMVSHGVNLALHVVSTILLAGLATRFVGTRAALLAALVWGMIPAHDGVVWWAVGRVDGLATTFMLLSARAFVRKLDDPAGSFLPWLGWFALALGCKESALALPGALVVAAWLLKGKGARVRAVLQVAPAILLLTFYFAIRHLALGRVLGGYQTESQQALDTLRGFALATGRVLSPYWLDATTTVGPIAHSVGLWVLGAVAITLLSRARVRRAIVPAIAAFALLCVPLAPLGSQLDAPMNQRVLHAATIPLAIAIGAAGPFAVLPLLLGFVPVHVERREQIHAAWQTSSAIQAHLLDLSMEDARLGEVATNWFVAGLPRTDASTRFVVTHLAADRLLEPPFAPISARRRVFALRPLDGRADSIPLPHGDTFGLPFASPTLAFDGPGILARLPAREGPELTARFDGPEVVSTGLFLALHERKISPRILVQGASTPLFRVTLFTAGGYVSAVMPGSPTESGHAIELASFLTARYVDNDHRDSAHVLFALGIATTFDLETRFPVLIESGEWRESPGAVRTFEALAAAREPIWLTFDRGVAEFLAGGR